MRPRAAGSAGHPTPAECRSAFLASLERMEQWLNAEQIPHAVFGSVAAAAWTDQGASLDFDRPGARHPVERIPDIDLLVPRDSLDRVKRYADAARAGDRPVSIDTFWAECWIDFRPGAPLSYLTHGKVRTPVPTELLVPSSVPLEGRQVAALDPRTLLHMYGVAGPPRRKDAPPIAALAEALASGTLRSRFTDQDCQPLATFALARRRRHPVFFAAKRAWVRVIDALPPSAAQALTHHVQLRANRVFRVMARRPRRPPQEAGALGHLYAPVFGERPSSDPGPEVPVRRDAGGQEAGAAVLHALGRDPAEYLIDRGEGGRTAQDIIGLARQPGGPATSPPEGEAGLAEGPLQAPANDWTPASGQAEAEEAEPEA